MRWLRFLPLLLVLLPKMSIAQQIANVAKLPGANELPGWMLYCAGMERELARQSAIADNATLYAKSNKADQNFQAAVVKFQWENKVDLTPEYKVYWQNRGIADAGHDLWDLIQSEGGPTAKSQLNGAMYMSREKNLESCDNLAQGYSNASAEVDAELKKILDAANRRSAISSKND